MNSGYFCIKCNEFFKLPFYCIHKYNPEAPEFKTAMTIPQGICAHCREDFYNCKCDSFHPNIEPIPKLGRIYLGNGVYVEFDGHVIILSTDINTIYLEPKIYSSLLRFIESLKQ